MKSRLMRLVILTSFIYSFSPSVTADERINNRLVIELHRKGFGEKTIIQKIVNSQTEFDTSLDALLRLKSEGLPDRVIASMIEAMGKEERSKKKRGDPTDPHSQQPTGIYFWSEKEGRLSRLEPCVFTQMKVGGFARYAFSLGIASVKQRGILPGLRASLRVHEDRPVFYFYLGQNNGDLPLKAFSFAATSPREIVLAKARMKRGNRELVICKVNDYRVQQGTLDKFTVPFDYEVIEEGIYRIVPKIPLADGEYCFYYGGGVRGGQYTKIFDFGIELGHREAGQAASIRDSSGRDLASFEGDSSKLADTSRVREKTESEQDPYREF